MRLPGCSALPWALFLVGVVLVAEPMFGATAGSAQEEPGAREQEIADVERQIDRIEGEAIAAIPSLLPENPQRLPGLGKILFFDKELSVNRNEACAFCHMPQSGYQGAIESINLTEVAQPGSVRTRFSLRKPPSAAYAAFSPPLLYADQPGEAKCVHCFIGGNFWDLRATGLRLQNPTAMQAEGSPLNPTEMANPDPACVVRRTSQRPYRGLFESIWGPRGFAITWPENVDAVCSRPNNLSRNPTGHFGYVTNAAGEGAVDLGVGNFLRSPENANEEWKTLAPQFDGRFRVPTLRNVDKRPRPDFVKAYGHNGYFKSLKEIVHFYNTRDVLPKCSVGAEGEKVSCWPPPETPQNLNTNCCNLGLSDQQEDDIVAFLKTLTDGYMK
jgi:cytochrome c peroxidase